MGGRGKGVNIFNGGDLCKLVILFFDSLDPRGPQLQNETKKYSAIRPFYCTWLATVHSVNYQNSACYFGTETNFQFRFFFSFFKPLVSFPFFSTCRWRWRETHNGGHERYPRLREEPLPLLSKSWSVWESIHWFGQMCCLVCLLYSVSHGVCESIHWFGQMCCLVCLLYSVSHGVCESIHWVGQMCCLVCLLYSVSHGVCERVYIGLVKCVVLFVSSIQ